MAFTKSGGHIYFVLDDRTSGGGNPKPGILKVDRNLDFSWYVYLNIGGISYVTSIDASPNHDDNAYMCGNNNNIWSNEDWLMWSVNSSGVKRWAYYWGVNWYDRCWEI